MTFCTNCGTQIGEGGRFCPACGQAVAAASPNYGPSTPDYKPPIVPGAPQKENIRDAQDNKVMAVLAYIIFFIPLLTGAYKTSPFIKYHTNQGTVLFVCTLAWGVAYGFLSMIITTIFSVTMIGAGVWLGGGWGLYGLIMLLLGLLWLIPVVLFVVGVINASNGQMKPLPIIGKITLVK